MPELERSEDEWKQLLGEERYAVLRKGGTERAFTGELLNEHGSGKFRCAGCDAELFDSATKYDSGSGWPSFFEPVSPDAVDEIEDRQLGMRRVEIRCHRCGGHLGHVFDDGPQPTGLRYCMNSASLDFAPAEADTITDAVEPAGDAVTGEAAPG